MIEVNTLKTQLTPYLTWNQARINLLCQFILALIKVRTVNLSEIANTFGGSAQQSSLLRVTRYFPLRKKRKVWGIEVYLSTTRTVNEYVIIITAHYPKNALMDYARHWEIETLFGCLKSRGFNLESTHLQSFLGEWNDCVSCFL